MTRNRNILFIPVILAVCLLLVGWADNWERIRRESADIQSVEARFIQKKSMKMLSRPLLSEGRFFFQAPDSVRWEYTAPVKSIMIMHAGTLRRYSHSGGGFKEEGTGRLPAMEIVMQEIGAWLHGRFDQSQFFEATLVTTPATAIILTPREKSFARFIRRIELIPSRRPGVLESILIVEDEKTTTRFEFRDVQVNKPIPEAIFQATP
jgi:outer membrane lipoprotein-sorting protein